MRGNHNWTTVNNYQVVFTSHPELNIGNKLTISIPYNYKEK